MTRLLAKIGFVVALAGLGILVYLKAKNDGFSFTNWINKYKNPIVQRFEVIGDTFRPAPKTEPTQGF